jgi:hypothetical protein
MQRCFLKQEELCGLPTATAYDLYRPVVAVNVCEDTELREVKVTCPPHVSEKPATVA